MPFSQINTVQSRLVKLFHFFATPQEDSPSVDFFFVTQAALNSAIDLLIFGETVVKSSGRLFSL